MKRKEARYGMTGGLFIFFAPPVAALGAGIAKGDEAIGSIAHSLDVEMPDWAGEVFGVVAASVFTALYWYSLVKLEEKETWITHRSV